MVIYDLHDGFSRLNPKASFMFMAILWNILIFGFSKLSKFHFHFGRCAIYLYEICCNWWHNFIVSSLIGDRIFLKS